ncbi:MAG: Glu/Leu/Phe/Val dehydrogenase dimerization domain-containing protein [Bacteroidota bacterium]
MRELLQKFENKKPEIVFEWSDSRTEAEGWVVINSLRGGAAGGGTRMRKGLDKHEVESLAKTMEVKFTISGPRIGGAKSGINFDPTDPRKDGVLKRWFAAVKPLLKYYYGTGGDLNVDEIQDVIPITEDVGVWHPQEGVFHGHFHPNEAQIINRIGQLRMGVIKVLEDDTYSPSVPKKYTVADMVTGFGVAEAVRHYYDLWGGTISEKRAVIQGWGNVGAAAGFYLSQMGVRIIGIIDKEQGLINPNGYSKEEIRELFLSRKGNKLQSQEAISFKEVDDLIWDQDFEIFIPAAASRLITKQQIDRMMACQLEVFSCGANVPFADPEIFFGPTGLYADQRFSVIPDFIANCGMARVFAYLMENEVSLDDEEIFTDTSATIKKALQSTYDKNNTKINLAKTSFEIALNQLV